MNKITIFNKNFWGEKIYEKSNQKEQYYIYCLNPIHEDKYLIIKNINDETKFFITKGFTKICNIIKTLKEYACKNMIEQAIESDIMNIKINNKNTNSFTTYLKKYYADNYSKFAILGQDINSFIQKARTRAS